MRAQREQHQRANPRLARAIARDEGAPAPRDAWESVGLGCLLAMPPPLLPVVAAALPHLLSPSPRRAGWAAPQQHRTTDAGRSPASPPSGPPCA